jgi:hypothetical protein
LKEINPHFRFCKYDPSGLFLPHYDGIYIKGMNERSILTLMFYLNEDFEGGNTNFLNES